LNVASTALPAPGSINLIGLVVVELDVTLSNLKVVIAPIVEIPEIALSTEIILTPIPITVVPAATTLVPAVLETTSPNWMFAVAIPLIEASNTSLI